MTVRIFTHNGQAHLDEIFAIAMIFVLHPAFGVGHELKILRVRELPEDFDPNVDWVVDLGMVLDPSQHRYDHHQLDPSEGQCAFSLLVRDQVPELYKFWDREEFPGVPSWFTTLRLVDSQGPFAFKRMFGGPLPGDAWQKYLTGMFSNGAPWLQQKAIDLVTELLRAHVVLFKEDQILLESAKAIVVRALNPDVMVVETADPRMAGAVERLLNWEPQDPPVRVGFDDRSPGWAVMRRADAPGWSFAALASDPRVEFAHKGGFIFKTKERIPETELLDLINQGRI
jgi:hypothetical protein